MISPERVNFTVLQVDRPILSGADAFLVRVADLGKRVLGSIAATAPAENILSPDVSLDDHSSEARLFTAHRPLSVPRMDVFKPEDLRMILLRRVVTREMATGHNLSHKAKRFNEKRIVKKRTGPKSPAQTTTVVKELDSISRKFDLDPSETPVRCGSVVDIHDPVHGFALALVPKAGQKAGRVLSLQAARSFEELRGQSAKTAYLSQPWVPLIPFASLPDDIEADHYTRMLELIVDNELSYPLRVVMGGVDAYCSPAAGRRNI